MWKPQIRFIRQNGAVAFTSLSLLFSWATCSQACSPSFTASIEKAGPDETVPPNTVFRLWNFSRETISLVLIDETGRRIPAAVNNVVAPTAAFLEEPVYSELRPFQPLAAGKYRLQYNGRGMAQEASFAVAGGNDDVAPPKLEKLSARIESIKVPVGVEPSCAPVLEKHKFVVLRFASPVAASRGSESLAYEVAWGPVVNGQPDQSRKKSLKGLRPLMEQKFSPKGVSADQLKIERDTSVLLLPLTIFESLKAEDKAIQIELFAVDRAGNKSSASRVELPARNLRATWSSKYPRANWVVPIDESLINDLGRFREAAATELDKGLFDLLQPIEASAVGEGYDVAFRNGILTQEGRQIPLRASLAGTPVPVTITLPVIVREGHIYPLVSQFQFRTLLDQLPFTEPRVEKIAIDFGGQFRPAQTAHVRVSLAGSSASYSWSINKPTDIKTAVRRLNNLLQQLEANDYYRALVGRYGIPSSDLTNVQPDKTEVDFATHFKMSDYVTVNWKIRDGKAQYRSFRSKVADLRVGELEKPLRQINQLLNLSDKQQDMAIAEINRADEHNTFKISVYVPNESKQYYFKVSQEGVVQQDN